MPGKSHGWRSLVGCSPRGREESDIRAHYPPVLWPQSLSAGSSCAHHQQVFFSILISLFRSLSPLLCGPREDGGPGSGRFTLVGRGVGGHSDPLQGEGACAQQCGARGYGLPPALLGTRAWVAGAVLQDILGVQTGSEACGSELHKCKGRSYLRGGHCEFASLVKGKGKEC